MKVVVSYINSLYSREETIKRIENTSADGIHVDLMDGEYVTNNNFDLTNPSKYLENSNKPIDIHLMVNKPSSYFDSLYALKPICIYIHPETENNALVTLWDIKDHHIEPGIAINPDERTNKYEGLYPFVKRVLLMSVTPGAGGQTFLDKTTERLQELKEYKKLYNFDIYIDGGINDETINKVLDADGVVSGSYICKSSDYEQSIQKLKK